MLIPAAFMAGLALTAVACRVGHRLGAMDSPGGAGEAKVLRSVPNIGGIAIAWPLIASLISAAVLVSAAPNVLIQIEPEIAEWIPRLQAHTSMALLLACSFLVIHMLGVIDDRVNLGVPVKLIVQFFVAFILVVGADIRLMSYLDALSPLGALPSVVLSIGWILVVMNAMNFLDNMDGLTAGTCVVAATALLITALNSNQWFVGGVLAILLGVTAGFLVFNLHPARIFLGDGGSLVIGLALAVLTIRTTYWEPEVAPVGGWYGLLMPVAVLAIPLYDFFSVTLIRLRQGKSPFEGDLQHFSHRLVARGLSVPAAMAVICGLSVVTATAGVLLPLLAPWAAFLAVVQVMVVLAVVAILETGGRA